MLEIVTQGGRRVSAVPKKMHQDKTFMISNCRCQSAWSLPVLGEAECKEFNDRFSRLLRLVFGYTEPLECLVNSFFQGIRETILCQSVGVAEGSRYTAFHEGIRFQKTASKCSVEVCVGDFSPPQCD